MINKNYEINLEYINKSQKRLIERSDKIQVFNECKFLTGTQNKVNGLILEDLEINGSLLKYIFFPDKELESELYRNFDIILEAILDIKEVCKQKTDTSKELEELVKKKIESLKNSLKKDQNLGNFLLIHWK